jgi:RNA polymerase sigma-70 factor (ECF subfamily)
MSSPEIDLTEFRPDLVKHAYHMLGTMTDAEDIVQDAYVRWHGAKRTAVQNPRAYLRATVTNLALDRLRSQSHTREVYVGPWLPEPIVIDETTVPEAVVSVAEDISFAFLLALDRLTPLERAAFLLHDALEVPFSEIAATLQRSEESVRALASRARKAIHKETPRRAGPPSNATVLRERFTAAILSGDIEGVQAMLTDDVRLLSDGGGKKNAAINPLLGKDHVGRFLVGVTKKNIHLIGGFRPAVVNGLPGFALFDNQGALDQTFAIEFEGERIRGIYISRNPDKLGPAAYVLQSHA